MADCAMTDVVSAAKQPVSKINAAYGGYTTSGPAGHLLLKEKA